MYGEATVFNPIVQHLTDANVPLSIPFVPWALVGNRNARLLYRPVSYNLSNTDHAIFRMIPFRALGTGRVQTTEQKFFGSFVHHALRCQQVQHSTFFLGSTTVCGSMPLSKARASVTDMAVAELERNAGSQAAPTRCTAFSRPARRTAGVVTASTHQDASRLQPSTEQTARSTPRRRRRRVERKAIGKSLCGRVYVLKPWLIHIPCQPRTCKLSSDEQ